MELNASQWKEFRLGTLFDMNNGFFNNKPETIDSFPSDTPIKFLGATAENNGITDYCGIESIQSSGKTGNVDDTLDGKLFDGNCITITNNGSVCHAYYQNERFTSSHDQTICIPNFKLNRSIALFICTIIEQERFKWSYGRKLHDINKSRAIIIKLPIQFKDGQPVIDETKKYSEDGYIPDWDFMKKYIDSLPHALIKTNNASNNILQIDLSKWEDFKIGKMFDIYPTKAYSCMTNSDLEDGGNTPFVINSAENNGIGGHSSLDATEEKNIITFSDTTDGNTFFYQPEKFIGFPHVQGMHPKNHDWTKEEMIFLTSILTFRNKGLFNYGRKMRRDIISNTYIKLPVQYENGQPKIDPEKKYSDNGYIPDWDFMDNYINSLPYSDLI